MTKPYALPAIELGEEADLGPAMRALTPRHRKFVVGKVMYGLSDVDAAQAAGYAEKSAYDHTWRIAQRDDVQAAILEVGKALLRGEGARSIRVMVQLRDNQAVKPEVRLKAAIELANRAGFHAVSESNLNVHHSLSEAEMDRRILALAAEMGMTETEARKMLIAPAEFRKNAAGVYEIDGKPVAVEDADFEEIADIPGLEGLV